MMGESVKEGVQGGGMGEGGKDGIWGRKMGEGGMGRNGGGGWEGGDKGWRMREVGCFETTSKFPGAEVDGQL